MKSDVLKDYYRPLLEQNHFISIPCPDKFSPAGQRWEIAPSVGSGYYWVYAKQDLFDIKIGISREFDLPRIKKLLSIGLFASLLHFAGYMILGWGVEEETLEGVMRMVSAYTATSDGGIFAAALLGLFGMVLEGLACFGIYRMIAPYSPKYAHSYRAGIFGYLIFGACGFHVPTCALVFLTKHAGDAPVLQYAAYFLLPAFLLFWIFFAVLEITQIKAFAKGQTPCPKWCWVFSMPVGMVIAILPGVFGNVPFANALSYAWIAFGNLWMFGGLLAVLPRVQKS